MNPSTGVSEGLELKTAPTMLGKKRLPVVDAFLWLVNIALVFLTTRYLSFLALFGVQHRLSDVLFGLGGRCIIGKSNVSPPPNARWPETPQE